MPAQYVAIRDSLVKQGKSYDEAQRIAAATYNKNHPGKPMHPQDEIITRIMVKK